MGRKLALYLLIIFPHTLVAQAERVAPCGEMRSLAEDQRVADEYLSTSNHWFPVEGAIYTVTESIRVQLDGVIVEKQLPLGSPRPGMVTACLNGKRFRLTGFPAPEVIAFAKELRSAKLVRSPEDLSTFLASLLSQCHEMAVEVTVLSQAAFGNTSMEREWRAQRPSSWPSEGTMKGPLGHILVTRTSLIAANGTFLAAEAFGFVFDEKGNLTSWSNRGYPAREGT